MMSIKHVNQYGHSLVVLLVTFMALALFSCGGDSGDTQAGAWVRIDYPTSGLSTGADVIVAKGNAGMRDASVYPSGMVNWHTNSSSGVAIQSTTCILACVVAWEATVPLDIGDNTLRVTYGDASDVVVFNRFTQVLVSGTVRLNSATGSGVADIPVTLSGTNVSLQTTTDNSGDYSFSNLVAGTYTINIEQPPAPQSSACLTLDPNPREVIVPADDNSDIVGQDFVVIQASTCYSIHGRVTASTNTNYGQSDIKLTIKDAGGNEVVKYSDSGGYFDFHYFEPGTYTLTPSYCAWPPCDTFTPDSRSVIIVDSDMYSEDFLRNF